MKKLFLITTILILALAGFSQTIDSVTVKKICSDNSVGSVTHGNITDTIYARGISFDFSFNAYITFERRSFTNQGSGILEIKGTRRTKTVKLNRLQYMILLGDGGVTQRSNIEQVATLALSVDFDSN